MKTLKKLLACNSGATSIEYAVVASMIGLTLITAASGAGSELTSIFTEAQVGLQKR